MQMKHQRPCWSRVLELFLNIVCKIRNDLISAPMSTHIILMSDLGRANRPFHKSLEDSLLQPVLFAGEIHVKSIPKSFINSLLQGKQHSGSGWQLETRQCSQWDEPGVWGVKDKSGSGQVGADWDKVQEPVAFIFAGAIVKTYVKLGSLNSINLWGPTQVWSLELQNQGVGRVDSLWGWWGKDLWQAFSPGWWTASSA